jgi:hypothetical protein
MEKKTTAIMLAAIFIMSFSQPVIHGAVSGPSSLYKISNSEFITLASASDDSKDSSGGGGKSPFIALGLSLIPGCIVHGSGYFYAGNKNMGKALVAVELISLASFGAGLVLAVLSGVGEIASLGQADTNSQAQSAGALMTAGVAGFAGSWLFDIIGSPIYTMTTRRITSAPCYAGNNTIRINLVKVSF